VCVCTSGLVVYIVVEYIKSTQLPVKGNFSAQNCSCFVDNIIVPHGGEGRGRHLSQTVSHCDSEFCVNPRRNVAVSGYSVITQTFVEYFLIFNCVLAVMLCFLRCL